MNKARLGEAADIVSRQKTDKKLLVIPSDYVDTKKMKIRIIELAFGLRGYYTVYLLTWHSVLSRQFFARVWNSIRDLFRGTSVVERESLFFAQIPLLHRPLILAPKVNSYFLRRFIKAEKIDTVLNGSYHMFSLPQKRTFHYILDLADLPAEGTTDRFDRFMHQQTGREIGNADAVTVVSEGLAGYVKDRYEKEAHVVHNGAYTEKMRSVDRNIISSIRRKYNLEGKWVIGYIGLIGPWVKVDLLVEAFKKIKTDIPNAALLLIGPSPHLKNLRRKYAADDIIVTGVLEGKGEPCVNAFDIGVLPHKKTFYQDLAFHIKLIEYTAARKIVVASPLAEVKRLDFPNIIQAELKVSEWVEAFKKAKETTWKRDWDKLAEPYDWSSICAKMHNIIEGIKR